MDQNRLAQTLEILETWENTCLLQHGQGMNQILYNQIFSTTISVRRTEAVNCFFFFFNKYFSRNTSLSLQNTVISN